MPFNDYLRNSVLNNVFGATAFAPSATLYLGLSTTVIADDGTGVTEPVGGGYARQTVTNDKTSWSTATGADNRIDNLVELVFPEATGAWGTVTHFFISDAATGGNILVSGALTATKTIDVGDVARFSPGNISIAIDEA
jgi:hypothetical protein